MPIIRIPVFGFFLFLFFILSLLLKNEFQVFIEMRNFQNIKNKLCGHHNQSFLYFLEIILILQWLKAIMPTL